MEQEHILDQYLVDSSGEVSANVKLLYAKVLEGDEDALLDLLFEIHTLGYNEAQGG